MINIILESIIIRSIIIKVIIILFIRDFDRGEYANIYRQSQ